MSRPSAAESYNIRQNSLDKNEKGTSPSGSNSIRASKSETVMSNGRTTIEPSTVRDNLILTNANIQPLIRERNNGIRTLPSVTVSLTTVSALASPTVELSPLVLPLLDLAKNRLPINPVSSIPVLALLIEGLNAESRSRVTLSTQY
jgi:hypothetical protein